MNKFQVQILKELRGRLVGECSSNYNTCPRNIEVEMYNVRRYWNGAHCIKYFGFINGYSSELFVEGCPMCPCIQASKGWLNPEELFVLIDEYIGD